MLSLLSISNFSPSFLSKTYPNQAFIPTISPKLLSSRSQMTSMLLDSMINSQSSLHLTISSAPHIRSPLLPAPSSWLAKHHRLPSFLTDRSFPVSFAGSFFISTTSKHCRTQGSLLGLLFSIYSHSLSDVFSSRFSIPLYALDTNLYLQPIPLPRTPHSSNCQINTLFRCLIGVTNPTPPNFLDRNLLYSLPPLCQ